ncbi:MAG TPA: hypothetical protein VFJ16_30740 [Longimicrobium sp.]|nr:hypothetical protein [Longimicrobium sp.]
MEDWIAETFNGASVMQMGIALFITLVMAWVFWIGARNSSRPPLPRDGGPGETP